MTNTPRKVLAELFTSLGGELPIRGGWGMGQEDACVIEKDDPAAIPGFSFDPWKIIWTFVEKRIYMELIVTRAQDDRFSGITWDLLERKTVHENGRVFEWMNFEVSAFQDSDWESLRAEWEGENGCSSPDFDIEAHFKRRDACRVVKPRAYWFDVTSCYSSTLYGINLPWVLAGLGRGNIVDYESTSPGQGYSVAYHTLGRVGVTSSIYFYTFGHHVSEDLEDELLIEHFKSVVRDIVEVNEGTHKKTCVLNEAGYFGTHGQEPAYLRAEFDLMSESDGPSKTFLYLKGRDGRFVKIRQSMPDDEGFKRQGINFIQEFTNILEGQGRTS